MRCLTQEQAADQEARGLAASYSDAANDELRGNIKKKLKEKLVAIFAMQQKRRTAEIASIEERLAKLKGISNKRETNKDAIVDRRLEQMTGGVDELGWEESNRGVNRYPGEELKDPKDPFMARQCRVTATSSRRRQHEQHDLGTTACLLRSNPWRRRIETSAGRENTIVASE